MGMQHVGSILQVIVVEFGNLLQPVDAQCVKLLGQLLADTVYAQQLVIRLTAASGCLLEHPDAIEQGTVLLARVGKLLIQHQQQLPVVGLADGF